MNWMEVFMKILFFEKNATLEVKENFKESLQTGFLKRRNVMLTSFKLED